LAAADDATADSLAAVQQLDALIDTLMEKKSPQELAQCVAENIMSFDQRFWLRLATRSDAAADEEQRQQLAALAKVVMQLVDSVVKRTNEQLSESTALLQDILKAAADEQVVARARGPATPPPPPPLPRPTAFPPPPVARLSTCKRCLHELPAIPATMLSPL
jgi:thymidylate synthase ThyX